MGQVDDTAEVPLDVDEDEPQSDVTFAEFPEEIPHEPTEEQKAKLLGKPSLDLRTDDFVPEYFEEVERLKPVELEAPTPVPEMTKKKSAKEFIKGTASPLCLSADFLSLDSRLHSTLGAHEHWVGLDVFGA